MATDEAQSADNAATPTNPMDAIESLLVAHSWDYETGECMCGAMGGPKHTAAVIGLWHGAIVGTLEDQRDRAEEALATVSAVARGYRRFPPTHDHRARFCADRPAGMEWTVGIRCLRCEPLYRIPPEGDR